MRLMYDRISVVQSLLHFKTRTPSGGNGSFLLSRSGGRMKQVFMESPEEALRRLGTDGTNGLTPEQVAESRRLYGSNALTGKKPDSLLKRIWNASCEPMLIMLILAAVIASGVNIARACSGGEANFLECLGIFAAIFLSVVITVVMEGRSAKAFEALNKINEDTKVKVVRGGELQLVPQREIVVGDILSVETGDKLPADGRLLFSVELHADESSLTGESVPVDKDAGVVFKCDDIPLAERRNMLYSGTFITGGHGRMLVSAVGDQTEFGQIAGELASVVKSDTPLQQKMAKLGKRITLLGSLAAALVFLIQAVTFAANGTASLDTVSEAFITSIVLIVAAVPEGLPTIVAVSLAITIIKMSKQNTLVKKMIACETIGCINVICSDKTGTLTENRMTVTDIYSGGAFFPPEKLKNDFLAENFCVNSTAEVYFSETGAPRFIGNPTECALLAAAHKSGVEYQACRSAAELLYVFPFSSETKNMTSILKGEGGVRIYTKGSPEKILSLCAVSGAEKETAEAAIREFQRRAGRVLAFAHRDMPELDNYACRRDEIEREMAFDGFAVISDPLRSDVPEAVARCRNAGIDLKILTGDNIVTASAIASELKLLDDSHIAAEAGDLEKMSDREFAAALSGIRVIARSTPLVKMRVVNTLKSQGNVVAVTGDGINDAPAIKNADVGVAMGITGTEVSKEASDIVLLDDSFSTIVRAVQWGRGIYENFQRFIQFQLTVNLSSVAVVLASILLGFKTPFTALQLLWVNIIMDGPPALTLGLEPIRDDLMKRRPVARASSIVSKDMLWNIALNGIFIALVFLAQERWNFLGAAPEQKSTVLFTLFVVFQLFNAFNSRELSDTSIFLNLSKNHLMLGVFALTFGLQVVITQWGGAFFNTQPLPLSVWGGILATGFSVILFAEFIKAIRRIAG